MTFKITTHASSLWVTIEISFPQYTGALKMVNKTNMGLQRQLSRRVSVVSGARPSRVLGRLVGVAILLAIGFLCGHFIYQFFVTTEHVIMDPEQSVKRDGSKRTLHIDDTHVLNSKQGAPKVGHSKQKAPHAENRFHVPPKERDGAEIKKDMSVQFRDYVPRKVFVNCGGTFPATLDLFLNTYPAAHKYFLYTFLPDESYSLFYQTYKRHTLYTPMIVSTENTTVESTNNGFASMVEQRDMIDTVDLPNWILTNLHQDDYVILKLDSQFEKEIVKNMGSKNAIEWIDKFYTTSEDNETISAYNNEIMKFNNEVSFWNNTALTYSDFDTVNPPTIPKGLGTVMSKCVDPTESEKFGLFLFSEQFTNAVNQTVNLLIRYAGERKVGVSMFLPRDFFRSISKPALRELSEIVTLGLFIGEEKLTGRGNNTTDEDNEFNKYRNMYVEAASHVHHHTESTLQYIMAASTIGADVCHRVCQSRQVTVFNEFKPITHHSQTILQNGVLTMDMIGRKPGEILAVDLLEDNADIITLYMTKRFEPWLVPATKCQPLGNRN